MARIFRKIKTLFNNKTTRRTQEKTIDTNDRTQENTKNYFKSESFSERLNRAEHDVRDIYNRSNGLKEISRTLRDSRKTQESCKKTFFAAIDGIQEKYGLNFEFVDFGVVQRLTKDPGNYSTYLINEKKIMMEKLPRKDNPQKADYEHMLRELRHEYGYFLLLKKYGDKANFPDIGIIRITEMLDQMHD